MGPEHPTKRSAGPSGRQPRTGLRSSARQAEKARPSPQPSNSVTEMEAAPREAHEKEKGGDQEETEKGETQGVGSEKGDRMEVDRVEVTRAILGESNNQIMCLFANFCLEAEPDTQSPPPPPYSSRGKAPASKTGASRSILTADGRYDAELGAAAISAPGGHLLPKSWPRWLHTAWAQKLTNAEYQIPRQASESREKDVLEGHLFRTFTSENRGVKRHLDVVRTAPALLNGSIYSTPEELRWALAATKEVPIAGFLLARVFERAQEDDEAFFTELELNIGAPIGQLAFRVPWDTYSGSGLEPMWAVMSMRQVLLDRLTWVCVVLAHGSIPPPIQKVFVPYPARLDEDEDAKGILKLLKDWCKTIKRFAGTIQST